MKFLQIDSDEYRHDLMPVIAAAIIAVIIIVVYNAIKYATLDTPESIPYNAVQLTSASVVISNNSDSETGSVVETKNVCVLSKGKYITNADAIKVALGDNQKYYTTQNYSINVIRPCSKQEPSHASVPAITSLKA
ncbi:hypothetical protein [uncultured Psychrobacter sp.]|uniref:hypothetical protein n=1 Tax=uncultured Psychrobacter sp. TaxID=259303 RepID=UPI0030DA6522